MFVLPRWRDHWSFLSSLARTPCVCIQWAKSNSLWTCSNVSFSSLIEMMSSNEKNFQWSWWVDVHVIWIDRWMIFFVTFITSFMIILAFLARQMKWNYAYSNLIKVLNLISAVIRWADGNKIDEPYRMSLMTGTRTRSTRTNSKISTYSHGSLEWIQRTRRDKVKIMVRIGLLVE